MPHYRFVGSSSAISVGGTIIPLNFWGQQVELSEADAHKAILDDCVLLPEEHFQTLGITDEEVLKYPTLPSHMTAPLEFQEKRSKAWEAVRDYRENLKNQPEPQAGDSALKPQTPAKDGSK